MDERLIWLNGEILPVSRAKVSILSPTAQFGANVFEGIRCYWDGENSSLLAFRLEDHFARLKASLKMFALEPPIPESDWTSSIKKIIDANRFYEDVAIRMTIFVDGDTGSWYSSQPVGMFIAPIAKARKQNPQTHGISASVSTWIRIHDLSMSPRIKAGANYINSRMAQQEAIRNGYGTCIFLNNQCNVAEGPGSCIFIVKNGRLITPLLTDSVLESITRDTVITLAKNFNIPVEERHICRSELYTADECFLCGSAAEITPIISIDKFPVQNSEVGEITNFIHMKYLLAATGRLEDFAHWTTKLS